MAKQVIVIPTHMRSRLAKSLRQVRLGQGLTQEAMGARYGVARTTWGGYELRESIPPTRVLIGLVIDYGLSIDYLLGITHAAYHPTAGLLSNIKRRNPLPRISGD